MRKVIITTAIIIYASSAFGRGGNVTIKGCGSDYDACRGSTSTWEEPAREPLHISDWYRAIGETESQPHIDHNGYNWDTGEFTR